MSPDDLLEGVVLENSPRGSLALSMRHPMFERFVLSVLR